MASKEHPYAVAVAAVRTLLAVAVTQYEQLESHFE